MSALELPTAFVINSNGNWILEVCTASVCWPFSIRCARIVLCISTDISNLYFSCFRLLPWFIFAIFLLINFRQLELGTGKYLPLWLCHLLCCLSCCHLQTQRYVQSSFVCTAGLYLTQIQAHPLQVYRMQPAPPISDEDS